MKKTILLIVLAFVGTAGWRIGNNLSSDAISMAVGIFFGVLAGIPTALLVLASDRHKTDRHDRSMTFTQRGTDHHHNAHPAYISPHQPPVIILNGPGNALPQQAASTHSSYLPAQHDYTVASWPTADWPTAEAGVHPGRRFKMVGEQEEWIE